MEYLWNEIQRRLNEVQPRLTTIAELGASSLRVWLVYLLHVSTASFFIQDFKVQETCYCNLCNQRQWRTYTILTFVPNVFKIRDAFVNKVSEKIILETCLEICLKRLSGIYCQDCYVASLDFLIIWSYLLCDVSFNCINDV